MRQHIREEQIIDYVLGQLSREEHFKINAHLATCPKCTNVHQHWEYYLNTEKIPVSPSLKDSIFREIDLKKNRFNVKWVYAVGSLCVFFLLFFGFLQSTNQNTSLSIDHLNHSKQHELSHPINNEAQYILPSGNNHSEFWSLQADQYNNHRALNMFSTSLFDYKLQETFLYMNQETHIIFVSNHSICSYEIINQHISCANIWLNPSNDLHFIPTHSNIIYLNH